MNFKSLMLIVLAGMACIACGCASKLTPLGLGKVPVPSASEESIDIQFGLARVAERNDRTEDAKRAYHAIISTNPKHAKALHRLGVIESQAGNFSRAFDYFTRAESLGNPSAELLGDFGYAQYLNKNMVAAAATLRRALELSPDDKRNNNNLALVLGMQGRYDDALAQFRQTGTEAESVAGLAFVQSQTGDTSSAKSNFLRALDYDSTLEVAANALVELEKKSPMTDVAIRGRSRVSRSPGMGLEVAEVARPQTRARVDESKLNQQTALLPLNKKVESLPGFSLDNRAIAIVEQSPAQPTPANQELALLKPIPINESGAAAAPARAPELAGVKPIGSSIPKSVNAASNPTARQVSYEEPVVNTDETDATGSGGN